MDLFSSNTESACVADSAEPIAETFCRGNSVTYSPEDNKLRLYVGRVPRDEYEALRKAGWTSTPKQSCDFVATWTPSREDQAREYLDDGDDIGDEDYSPQERAADRAERFAGYLDKRRAEAGMSADRFESGPNAFGHQSRARAERLAARHDRIRTFAVSQWSKAEYWQERTAGVIANALHKSDARTRRGRIDVIETELRRMEKHVIAAGEISSHYQRWIAHYNLRLTYENSMLANEGGRAGEVNIVPGGFFRSMQIIRVYKSPATGRVSSVVCLSGKRQGRFDVTRAAEHDYRAPTAEELEAFAISEKERKKAIASSKPKVPPIINPTPEDAERLQAAINAAYRKRWDKDGKDSKPINATQAAYRSQSKGNGSCEMVTMYEMLDPYEGVSCYGSIQRFPIFRIRLSRGHAYGYAKRVVVITDKPSQPIPWEAVEDAASECPTPESLIPRAGDLYKISCLSHLPDKDAEAMQLIADAIYAGIFYKSSWSQFGFNATGREWYQKHGENKEAA